MKKKSLLLYSGLALLSVSALSGCTGLQDSNTIVVWVGSESVEYYRQLAKKYTFDHPEFGYKISIIGADAGGAGGQMASDNTACGDIVTIAHDNIGKLSQASYIAPIVDSNEESIALLNQIDEDNPATFKRVIQNILGDDSTFTYTFAVPYISQALFLYYDTRYVTEDDAKSFEGLEAAAARYDQANGVSGTKGYAVTGSDGYNYSFSLLSRNLSKDNTSTLRLYENGDMNDAYVQSNEQVAVMKWTQRHYAATNGFMLETSQWAVEVKQHHVLSLIGGAWHYNAFKKSVTDDNGEVHMGCAIIPTFTLTADDVAGINQVNYPNDEGIPEELRGKVDPAPTAGTIMRGGSFVDCKVFVINMAKMTGPEKYYKMCTLLKYFSSKDAQNESFIKCLNVPAYQGSFEFIQSAYDEGKVDKQSYLMAASQTGMSEYGIPQPFVNGTLNTFFYSMNAPQLYTQCVKNTEGVGDSVDKIRATLFKMEYTWKHGATPAEAKMPTTFPYETTPRIK